MDRGSNKNIPPWFIIVMACLPLLFSLYVIVKKHNFIFLVIYFVMGLVTLITYFIDKNRAIKQQWRIPEFTLHILELLGGWSGGLLAQHYFRHKNKKLTYQLVFWSIVGLHIVGWVLYIVYFTK